MSAGVRIDRAPRKAPRSSASRERIRLVVRVILVTFGTVYMVAEYAYPEAPATQLASAAP